MLNNKQIQKAVAAAVFECLYRRSRFVDAHANSKAEAIADARTIISAYELGQTHEEAAARLATWHWIDRRKPHVPWAETDESIRSVMLRKARIGFDAITACKLWPEDQAKVA